MVTTAMWDYRRAVAFLASADVPKLLEKYPEAADGELQSDPVKLGCYLMYREQGMEHWLAAMNACRRAPQMKGSDRAFNQGLRRTMDGMKGELVTKLLAQAKRAGISTQGRYYVGGLADKRMGGDPGAWVSTTDDILAVARQRNYDVTGNVTHRVGEVPPPKRKRYDPRLLREFVNQKLKSEPELRHQVRRDKQALKRLQTQLIEKHWPKPVAS